MLPRLASLGAGLTMIALLLSGCFATPGDGVFGPADSLGGAESGSPALSIKASPARGPGPLEVEFSLGARQSDGPVSWSLDFGDRSAPATGNDLPASPRHTYRDPGAYVATFLVRGGDGEATTTLSIVVLEGLVPSTVQPSPTQGPEPPGYSPPQSSSSSSSGSTSSSPPPTSSSSTTSEPPTNSTSESSSASSTSESTTTSDTGTSSSSTASATTEEPTSSESSTTSGTQSSSDSQTTTEESSPSESQSSSDPPL